MTGLLTINIGINPNIGHIFGLLLAWHGVFTAVGIVCGVWLAVRLAATDRVGIDPDTGYTLGMIVVACGIVGARGLYVAEHYGDAAAGLAKWTDVFKINEGGISIYGAILGGAAGGWAYGLWKRERCAAGADAGVFGMILGMGIGRIGDIINGEHLSKLSHLPWAVTYSNPNSPSFGYWPDHPQHPAVAYEMIGDFLIIGIMAILWRRHVKSGVIFASAFLLYAALRFGVSFFRLHTPGLPGAEASAWLGLSVPQFIALVTFPMALALLVFFAVRKEPEPSATGARQRQLPSRAERRRRLRAGS